MWIAIGLSYYSLAKATTGLPVGVAFAFWEALGLALITLSSIYILDEPFSLQRLAGLLCALSGALLITAPSRTRIRPPIPAAPPARRSSP